MKASVGGLKVFLEGLYSEIRGRSRYCVMRGVGSLLKCVLR